MIATSWIILSNEITFLLCMDSIPLSQVKDDNEYVCSRGKVKKKKRNLAMLFLPLKLLLLVVTTVLCMMQNHLLLLSWYFLWVISSPSL